MIYRIENQKKAMPSHANWTHYEGDTQVDNNHISTGTAHLAHFKPFATCATLLALNQDMIDQGRDCFRQNYRDTSSSPSFLQDLVISWLTFYNKVVSVNNALESPIPLNRLALKFIHRYDTNNSRWFLTVQLCQISGTPLDDANPERTHESFALVSVPGYFNINYDGTISVEDGSGLAFVNGYEYGVDYFNNIFCGVNKVSLGRNVQSVVFALDEIRKMHDDNVITGISDNDSLFSIVFASASSETEFPSLNTYVKYPHCMVVFMQYNGVSCLDDNHIILGNFYNKAADYNTLCPRRCGYYLCPTELLAVIE